MKQKRDDSSGSRFPWSRPEVDKIMTRHEISSSPNLRSEPSLSDSDVELGFVADTPWAKQVEAEVFGF
ncbi:hypothetical protein QYF36_017308 [Acer negundo]|nr:hypothetical protein QYF36_017308 [Acer negundo]